MHELHFHRTHRQQEKGKFAPNTNSVFVVLSLTWFEPPLHVTTLYSIHIPYNQQALGRKCNSQSCLIPPTPTKNLSSSPSQKDFHFSARLFQDLCNHHVRPSLKSVRDTTEQNLNYRTINYFHTFALDQYELENASHCRNHQIRQFLKKIIGGSGHNDFQENKNLFSFTLTSGSGCMNSIVFLMFIQQIVGEKACAPFQLFIWVCSPSCRCWDDDNLYMMDRMMTTQIKSWPTSPFIHQELKTGKVGGVKVCV